MTFSTTRNLILAAAIAAAPLAALPALAQERGVSVTIRKAPSYLNTRTTPRPGSYSRAAYDTTAVYQSSTPTRGVSFGRWPLPSSFDLPGY